MPQSAYADGDRRRSDARSSVGQPAHLAGDQVRLVVQQRRQRVYVDRPAAARDDLGGGWAIAPQAIERDASRSAGKASWSTNRSLKSGRSESST